VPSERFGDAVRIDERSLPRGRAATWVSENPTDRSWDDLLRRSGVGQFQQSAFWMQAKQGQGWNPIRAIVTLDGEPAGGFQILWRKSMLGRLAYVSKGPVLLPAAACLADYVVEMLRAVSRTSGLRMLIVQPPDLDRGFASRLPAAGFLSNVLYGFNTATWLVDLRNGFSAVEAAMSRSTRKKIRHAAREGITIREGGRDDLETFFRMMLTTCARQRVKPQPSSADELRALWDAAYPGHFIRLTLAELAGEPVAGLVSLIFANTVTFWKKGWTTEEGSLRPNDLLMYEALKWSEAAGHQFCDYSALDRSIAIALIEGKPLSAEQEKSRHMFNIRLGGFPRVVPESRVYFPNPFVRRAYRIICARAIARLERTESMSGSSAMSTINAR